MRVTNSALVVAVVVLLAGCSGAIGTADSQPEATTTDKTTSPAPTTAAPNTTTVNQSQVVDFQTLSTQQQSAFLYSLDDNRTAVFAPSSPYLNVTRSYDPEIQTPFRNHEYVRYNGSLYRAQLPIVSGFAIYDIEASASNPPDNASVTAFDSLPETLQDEIRIAITNGTHTTQPGEWDSLPEPLEGGGQYVRYENRTYILSYGVADGIIPGLTVTKVE